MRELFILAIAALIIHTTPAQAGPPCNIHVGGLCGADYDGWMSTWHRSNPGKTIQPVSPGGYGIYPNGQRFYPQNGVGVGGAVYQGGGYYGQFGRYHHQYRQPQQTVVIRPVIIGYGTRCTVRDAYGNILRQYDGPCPH